MKRMLILFFCLLLANYVISGKVGDAFESLANIALDENSGDGQQMDDEEFQDKMHTLTDLTSSLFAKMFQLVPHSGDFHPPEVEIKTFSSDGLGHRNKEASAVSSLVDSLGNIPFNMASEIHGDHVCIREINKVLPPDATGTFTSKNCYRYAQVRKCVNRRITPTGGRETIRLHECCDGYATNDIVSDGCRLETASIDETLPLLNSDSDGQTTAISYNDVVLYTLPGLQNTFDWGDSENLTTSNGATLFVTQMPSISGIIETRLNCVPIVKSAKGAGGIVHELAETVHPASKTLLEIIENDDRFSIYKSLLDEDLQKKLADESKIFTLFVFTNEAFEVLPRETKEQMMSRDGCAADLLRGLIVRGAHCSRELHSQRALDGSQLLVTNSMKKIIVMGSSISEKDYVAENGVVHVVDEIPLREEFLSWKNTVRIYNEDLIEAIDEMPDSKVLTPLTVFIPENFTLKMTSEMALNQMAAGYIHLSPNRRQITTLANSSLFVSPPPSSPFLFRMRGNLLPADSLRISCVTVRRSQQVCNALLHFTESPFPLVSESIESYLSRNLEFSKFYNLLVESTVLDRLADYPAITIFAPTNDAFSNNFYKRLYSNPQVLEQFVQRHIVTEAICESDMRRNADEIRVQVFQNLNGEALRPTQAANGQLMLSATAIEGSPKLLADGIVYTLESSIEKEYREIRPGWQQRRRAFGTPANLLDYFFNTKKA